MGNISPFFSMQIVYAEAGPVCMKRCKFKFNGTIALFEFLFWQIWHQTIVFLYQMIRRKCVDGFKVCALHIAVEIVVLCSREQKAKTDKFNMYLR